MSRSGRIGWTLVGALVAALVLAGAPSAQQERGPEAPSAMANPYMWVEGWPRLGDIPPGAAIGIIPDNQGGVWLMHRSEPPILKIDAAGNVVKAFGEGTLVFPHGFCQDRDGNLWAGDSGSFSDKPEERGRGFVFHKFSPDGELLLTLGQPGVSKAGPDTFIMPTACTIAPNGDIVIADGHIPRPSYVQQDGDRIVRFTTDGEYVGSWGRQGVNPGEFWGPHALAYDSQGRLFVGDRSNNRVQIFDQNMNFVDDWRHFGRPSGLWITRDDTLLVADSESSYEGFRPTETQELSPRNAGWQNGIRIGSARDGSLKYFIGRPRPEGLAADELGNVFGGLVGQCGKDPGYCLMKYVPRFPSGLTP